MNVGNYHNIPLELKQLKQWILWRYEDIGAAKPTKVPYTIYGKPASVTEATDWFLFDDVIKHVNSYSGIGFVFTRNDPYTFIDLDDAEGDQAVLERHLKVYHEFVTYAETSPSNKGLHLICRGKVVAGRRRSKIEIYPHDRYATMTGNVYGGRTIITDCQNQLDQLFEQMGSGPVAQSLYQGNDKEQYTDEQIIKQATDAVNGDRFKQLWEGEWNSSYNSQSEADFALVDIIAFYTQNRNQIARIFRASALGKRDKAKRQDYLSGMISRSFDRMLPPLDFDGLKNQLELKLNDISRERNISNSSSNGTSSNNSNNAASNDLRGIAQLVEPTAHNSFGAGSNPAAPTTPPGLLGDIAQFIYQAAPRPVPEVALAAAIALMAGITGRAYNISGTGLNQYVLLLAMTGAGKEAAAEGIDKLMATIKFQVPTSTSYIGPGEISSGTGLIRHLNNHSQSFVSLIGEFGLKLQQISSPLASSSEVSLRRMILDLYNKSGYNRTSPASAYAKKEDSTSAIPSPAVTILGESTPERFYGGLTEDMISEGLLPRFLTIEYKGNRPASNDGHVNVIPSFTLIERLAALVAQCESLNHSNPRRVINVNQSPEAAEALKQFDKYCDARINGSNKEVIRQLWNRAHIKVLKLSAILAVGQNMFEPTIQYADMQWAADLVYNDIANITEKFELGEIGNNTFEIKQAQEIIRVIRDYMKLPYEQIDKYTKLPKLHLDKVIPYIYIQRRLVAAAAFRNDRSGPTISIKRAIQTLLDNDRIKELGKVWANERYGTSQRCFVVSDTSILD